MVSLHWQKKYELGVQAIDLQHHYFVELINRMADEFEQTANYDYCHSLIEELNAYTRFHFVSEENMMILTNYPQLDQHRDHHHKLLSELSNMEIELDMERNKANFDKMLDFLTHWFLEHTSIEDRQFAEFLKQQQ